MRAALVALAPLVIWTGCATATPPASPEAAPVPVTLATVEAGEVHASFEAGGIVQPKATALIASRILAPVADVRVRAGDHVRRGEVLIILDAHDTRLGASQAAAGARSADQSVRAAEAEIAATTAALALATATHGRVAALYAKRSATAEELDRATAERAAAESAAAAAGARHEAAMAAREGAHDGADAAGVTAGYATLTAPFDGIVTDRRVDPGSMATPGAPLLTVEDSARYRLEIQADQTRAAGLRPGQVAEVQIDGLGDASAWSSAEVAEIGRLDPASHGFLVKIDLPANGAWRSGLFGRARFPEAARRAVTAPNSALVRRGQITFVFLADGDHARLRPVSTGVRLGDRVEVLAGLRPGDRVVADPALTLADGARIRGAVR